MNKMTKLVNGVVIELTGEERAEVLSRKPPPPEKPQTTIARLEQAIKDLAAHVGYKLDL